MLARSRVESGEWRCVCHVRVCAVPLTAGARAKGTTRFLDTAPAKFLQGIPALDVVLEFTVKVQPLAGEIQEIPTTPASAGCTPITSKRTSACRSNRPACSAVRIGLGCASSGGVEAKRRRALMPPPSAVDAA